MLPHTENSLVPVLFGLSGRPNCLYHSAPLFRMCGAAVSVSTLLIVVGWANRPATAGKGGLMRGLPRRPSREFISAVPSPPLHPPPPPGPPTSPAYPAPPVEGSRHRRLRAAEGRGRALVDVHVHRLARTHRVRAQDSGGVRFLAR